MASHAATTRLTAPTSAPATVRSTPGTSRSARTSATATTKARLVAISSARSIATVVIATGAVGTVEAAELWLFGLLGHSPEVGVAVGLAVRLRDLVWAAPGFIYLLVRALRPPLAAAARPVVTPQSAENA